MSYDDRKQQADTHNREIGFIDSAPISHEVTDERRAAILKQQTEQSQQYSFYGRRFMAKVDKFVAEKEAAKKVAA